MSTRWRSAMLVFVLALMSGCTEYQALRKCGQGCPGDADLAAAVRSRLHEHTEFLAPNQVDVHVIDGVVYLGGQVSTELQRDDAEEVARQTPGVRHVVDIVAIEYPGW